MTTNSDKQEYVTIGAIARRLEEEAFVEGADNEKAPFSARSIERRFRDLLNYIDVDFKIVKDANNNYSFEKEGEAFIEVLLIETVTPNSFFKNMITNKEERVSTQDIIDTYKRAKERIEMKVSVAGVEQYRFDYQNRMRTLIVLDKIMHYNLANQMIQIDEKLVSFRESLNDFSYGEQVCLMSWLNNNIEALTRLNKFEILEAEFDFNKKLAQIIKEEGESKYFAQKEEEHK